MKGVRGMYPFLNIYKFPQWRYFPKCLEDLFPRREEHPPTPFARGIQEHINIAPSRSGNPNSSHPPHTG